LIFSYNTKPVIVGTHPANTVYSTKIPICHIKVCP
jgi:hypothetical protein